jgi:hypothetical protein
MRDPTLLQILDDCDEGQEDNEPILRIPGLTAGDVRYLKSLVEADQKDESE